MLNKEEIEKAKEWLNWMKKHNLFLSYIPNILQYIKELEADNYEANNIINEYIEDRRKMLNKLHDVIDDDVYSDIEYSIRRNLAQEL